MSAYISKAWATANSARLHSAARARRQISEIPRRIGLYGSSVGQIAAYAIAKFVVQARQRFTRGRDAT